MSPQIFVVPPAGVPVRKVIQVQLGITAVQMILCQCTDLLGMKCQVSNPKVIWCSHFKLIL